MFKNVEDFQKFNKDQIEAATAATATLQKGIQQVATEASAFSKKHFETSAAAVEKLLGANCQLNIQHVTKDGKLYANVVSIVPLGKNMPKMVAKDYVRVQDRTDVEREAETHEPLTAEEIFTPF